MPGDDLVSLLTRRPAPGLGLHTGQLTAFDAGPPVTNTVLVAGATLTDLPVLDTGVGLAADDVVLLLRNRTSWLILGRIGAGGTGGGGDTDVPGVGPGALTVTLPAAATISGHRAVTVTADGRLRYASDDEPDDVDAPIWVSAHAAVTDELLTAVTFGPLTEPTWSWPAPCPVWLGAAGALTATPPTVADGAVALTQLGWATAADTVHVDRQPSIALT